MSLDQAREYLARVIPWPQPGEHGFVNIHWTFPPPNPRPDGKPAWAGRAVTSMADATKALEFSLRDGSNTQDIYACMSQQAVAEAKTGSKGYKYNKPVRLAANAINLKSFFLDIDLKPGPKGYSSWDELVSALADFIHKTGMPKPTMMVHSGGGVHVYWIVNRALTPDEWLPLSASLVEAVRQTGLKCDTQCTIDSARVLRIPDTFNYKEPVRRAVRFIGLPLEFDYSLERISVPLSAYTPTHVPAAAGASIDRNLFPQRTAIPEADELQSALDDLRPRPKLDDVVGQCLFLENAVVQGGSAYDNPLWNLTTLVATFTEGGRADAHRMAQGHAEYSQDETDALFDRKNREKAERGLGWPSCSAIAGAGATACNSCAFRAHGKSPLNFEQRPVAVATGPVNAGGAQALNGSGAPQATAFGPAVLAPSSVTAQPVGQLQQAPAQSDLPTGYQRDAQGVISRIVADPNNPGANLLTRISDYPMLDAWLQDDPKVLHFESVIDRHKRTQIDLPLEVTATNEMRKVLQSQGMMLPTKDTGIGDFFVAWINRLQLIKDSVHSSPFGWLNRAGNLDGFVFGDRLWTPAGTEPAATSNQVLAQRYRPKGSDIHWLDAAKLVCGVGRPDLEALVASAFAAPLVQFTGHKGALMSAFSRESGIGKTTAVVIAQSVWGNPVKGIQGLSDTENAVMGIVGEIKSLPLYWDELKTDQDTKKFVKMTFQISSGKGKSRMNSRAELKEPGDWQTLVISASNESLIDHVVSQTNTTAAGLMRIFEYKVSPPGGAGRVATSDATIRLAKLNNNYGHVGLRYAQFLGANHASIATDMAALAKQVEQETSADQEERFWVSVVACVLLGARYATQIGYPVFDEAALKTFMYASLNDMRGHRKNQTVDLDQSINVSAILNTFFKDVKKNGTWLVTNRIHVGVGKPAKPPNPNAIQMLYPNDVQRLNGVDVQVGVDNQLLRISSSALGHWCKKNEVNKVNLLDALGKACTITQVKNGRMGAGTTSAGANEHIIEIDLTSSSDLDFVRDML
jgi:hypothetical protein